MSPDPVTRRRALRTGAALLGVGFAGCQTGDDATPSGVGTAPTDSPTAATDDGTGPTGEPISTTDRETSATAQGTTRTETSGSSDTVTSVAGDDGSLSARRVASGFTSPVDVAIPQRGRRFVVDQSGQVYLQDSAGVHREPFLDVSDRMVPVSGFTEQGLLGIAFHPEFADNGRFFVRYSAPPREGTPSGYSHTFVLSEFHADPGARRADPDSERTILTIPEPQANHNAGAIAFGPDDYLYVAVGDGGAANDQGNGHVEDWYDAVGGGNGQDVTENLLGSVLRIDVDSEPSGTARNGGRGSADGESADRPYAVPEDNPLVGEDGLDEHYAWGFRNPWRLSFGPEGRLFVGDVGQDSWEEVDVVDAGGNYGWNVKEGTHCFRASDCPSTSPRGRALRDPVIEYPQSGQAVSGVSVICGYPYAGSDMPAFDGQFIFADWRAGGQLYAARERDDGLWQTRTVAVESGKQFGPNVLSFGRSPADELFVCTSAAAGVQGDSGAVFRLGESA